MHLGILPIIHQQSEAPKTLGIEYAAGDSYLTHEQSVTCAPDLSKTIRLLESSKHRTAHMCKTQQAGPPLGDLS